MRARGGVQVFSPTLLVEGRDDQLKYGSCLHSSKLCVWGGKKSSTRARSLASPGRAGPGRAKGAGARHLREWSAEIWPLALRGRGFLLPFYFLVTWSLSQRDIWNPNRFRSRSRRVGVLDRQPA